MLRKYFFALFLFVCTQLSVQAQSSKNRKDSTVVIIFNENKTERSKSKKTGEDNVVKISPLGFITGTYPIYFERRINDFLTVQVGAGVTGKNYLRGAIQKQNDGLSFKYPWGENSQITDDAERLYNFDYRKPTLGYMFSIQPRLYFDSEAPDGSFLAVSYDYYNYNFSIPGLEYNSSNGGSHTGSSKSENEKLNDIMVHFGYQTIYDKLTLEYTSGIGLRNVSGSKYAAYVDYANNRISNEGLATYKQTTFNFSITLKVGYHF
jgi:hypothetical protein